MIRCALSMMLLAAAMSGCGSRGKAVPRPVGYPRITLPEPEYAVVPETPIAFEVNSAAASVTTDTASNGAVWLTSDYPALGATVYVTFTPVADDEQALEVSRNRYERMTRDIGSGAERHASESPAGEYAVYLAGGATPTPAAGLLVADDARGRRWVVSATVSLSDEDFITRPDSLAPVRDYVIADMVHGFKTSRPL